MNIWIVCVGEPLPIDGENTRLRRMGNLANYISTNKQHSVEWFSSSFNHYQKRQRTISNKRIQLDERYFMNIGYANGYKKNVSISRIIHHKRTASSIYKLMLEQEKPDVIVASMEPLEVANIAIKYGKKNNIPVVVDVRDLWPEIFYEVLPKCIAPVIKPYIDICKKKLRYIMSNAHSIIGLSRYFVEYGVSFSGRDKKDEDRVFPIAYPNYNYQKYNGLFNKNWSKHNIKKEDFIITFMGNFGRQFNFKEIVEASKILINYQDIKFVLCGLGEQIEDVKEKSGENIIFPGWIEKEAIASLLSSTSIGIAPYINSVNYRNNTPNKFGEYLSASLPVIVSVKGEMDNLLKKYECGGSYLTSEELVEKIVGYYNDAKLLQSHKHNSRELYNRMFNSDMAYEDMTNYLIGLVKNNYNK